ncbi:MAG: phytanoyl-CoA dioxygenase family protein [Immundisolibacterales bacterium]|nr:phytanoyl-CoA dioxygenase family protein [Immundisolibacterales bacterium]
MTPEEVLSHPPRALSQSRREFYFENGYLAVERFVDDEWLERLRRIALEFVERSRAETRSGNVFDVAPGHSASAPRLRRLKRPDERHEVFWRFATGAIADVAADLVGPDVVFHHSKLNYKWNDGADQVDWHQDIQFYPHTNYSPLTIGVYLRDTGYDDGALGFIPGSHNGPLFDQYNDKGQWAGCLGPADAAALLPESSAVYVEAPAGSITVHNCRTVHGSPASRRDDGRPLLLNAYASADALPYTPHPDPSRHAGRIVRGRSARWAHHDPRPCLVPPDWSGGYTSIFAAQTGEDASARVSE